MPTFGNATDLGEHQQAAIDAAEVGYEAFLQSLNPADRAEVERQNREALEEQEGQLEAKSVEAQQQQKEATPEARDEAERLDVDLTEVQGSGDRGRVLVEDVRHHAGIGEKGNGGND